ncbi:MAG: ABC transporter permease [Steroidobacteraceae bacterium]
MGRFGFIARRFLQAIPMLLSIVFVVFLLLKVTPGDPARNVAGLRASPQELVQVRSELGIDRPMLVQYWSYLSHAVQGDLGYSYKSRETVTAMIGARLGATTWLVSVAIVMVLLITIPLAIIAATRQGQAIDHGIRIAGLLGLSMPAFWVGVMLLLVIALPTGWFPAGGFGETPREHLRSVILPALTLAIGMAPVPIRSLRASIIAILSTDYVATARSLGIPAGRIIRRFVLRNAAVPFITVFALEIGFLLFGTAVVETTFALPGVGQGLVLAARGRDLPAIQGYTLLYATLAVVVYLLADILTALLDPRVEIDS